jgi:uncharacterized protein with HEPN domain
VAPDKTHSIAAINTNRRRLMKDFRDFAVHEYWGVDPAVIWKTISDHLPALLQNLHALRSSDA